MSYILDALHKSEQARQRGRVPDLNTLATAPRPALDARPASPSTVAIAGLMIVSGLVALGWWRPWEASPLPLSPPAQQASALTAKSLPATPPPPPPVVATPREASRQVEIAQAKPPAPALPTTSAPLKKAERLSTPNREPEGKSPPPPAAPPPTRAQPRRILAINELPPAVRAALPRLEVSGYAYAGDSGRRMVVVNDRLVHEGDEAAAGVTLLSAAQDGVVFEFQGHRFRGQP